MGMFLTLPFTLSNFSSRCLRRSDPPGLSPSLGGALQLSARCQHGRGSSRHPCLSPATSPAAAPPAAAHHRPQAPAGSETRALLPLLPPGSVPPPPGSVRRRKAKLSPLCIHPKLQDPEVQKHATQILRNMLRQEEAELQVRRRHGFSLPRNGGGAALGARPWQHTVPVVPPICSALFTSWATGRGLQGWGGRCQHPLLSLRSALLRGVQPKPGHRRGGADRGSAPAGQPAAAQNPPGDRRLRGT